MSRMILHAVLFCAALAVTGCATYRESQGKRSEIVRGSEAEGTYDHHKQAPESLPGKPVKKEGGTMGYKGGTYVCADAQCKTAVRVDKP